MATRHDTRRTSRAVSRKQKPARRKAHKAKTYEVRGHQLTAEQFRVYEASLESRRQTNWKDDAGTQERIALSDTLYHFLPSTRAKERFLEFGMHITEVGQAVSGLRDFQWHSRDVRIRAVGNELIAYARDRLTEAAAELARMYDGIKAEVSEGEQS